MMCGIEVFVSRKSKRPTFSVNRRVHYIIILSLERAEGTVGSVVVLEVY